jgi:hypothetical protein
MSTDPSVGRRPAVDVALVAVFTGLAVALGFALAAVPNVELSTLTIFAAGATLGRCRGALVGGLTAALYSGLNPAGSGLGLPPLFAAQIIAWALVGLVGGLTGRLFAARSKALERRAAALRPALAGGLGLALTLAYQGAVIVGLALAGFSPAGDGVGWSGWRTDLLSALAANALFSLVHVVSNGILFAILVPQLVPRLRSLGRR